MWKLRFSKPIYYSGNNKTVCVYNCTILRYVTYLNTYKAEHTFKVTGTARRNPDDVNDAKLGRILADSRAKKQAYQKAREYSAGKNDWKLNNIKEALADALDELSFIVNMSDLRDKETIHIQEIIDKIKD